MNRCLSVACMFVLLYGAYWDHKQRIIPNRVPLSLVCLAITRLVCGMPIHAFGDHLLGVVVPTLVLFMLYVISPNGMGGGDYKLILSLGAFMGMQQLSTVLLLACLLSLGYCLLARAKTVPFAVPVCAAYCMVMVLSIDAR